MTEPATHETKNSGFGPRVLFWLLALVALAGLAFYSFWIAPRALQVTQLELLQTGIDRDIRLVVMGDLQPAGPHETYDRIADVVALMNQQKGDIILLLGDYVTTRAISTQFIDPEVSIPLLAKLQAPMGVYTVLGNHDWWWDGPRMRRLLAAQGITVLEDRAVRAEAEGIALWIAGLADPVTQRPDLIGTLRQADESAPTILLTHSPDVFPDVPSDVALTLAGHTHGGQVDLPFLGKPIVPSRYGSRYAYGLIEEGLRRLYVTSGVGTAIVPIRFRVPPEIAVITLRSTKGTG